MNTSILNASSRGTTLIAAIAASLVLAACAAGPTKPEGAAEARAKLTRLQNNPDLATRASVAMKDAEAAVIAAEKPELDKELARHRVYIADHKVEIAAAQANTSLIEDQRAGLSQQRDQARLNARTSEADAATSALASARVEMAQQQRDADASREAARLSAAADATQAAADAAQAAAELQRQLDELNAKETDRGMVLTLGDVLFTSGQADLKGGATANLNKLVTFLNAYPNRTVMIEGHTDSLGSDDFNSGLSQRRADSVKSYLTGQGIGPGRLSASGMGESSPVADNGSATGRQQNRRVEVVIVNQTALAR
jgi:outer membrane protein OmpA-like peptidoglycan-associated protein